MPTWCGQDSKTPAGKAQVYKSDRFITELRRGEGGSGKEDVKPHV